MRVTILVQMLLIASLQVVIVWGGGKALSKIANKVIWSNPDAMERSYQAVPEHVMPTSLIPKELPEIFKPFKEKFCTIVNKNKTMSELAKALIKNKLAIRYLKNTKFKKKRMINLASMQRDPMLM